MTDDFSLELRRLDLLVHREILRLRATYQLTLDESRGVYVSDERVDDLLRDHPAGAAGIDELSAEARALRARIGGDSPLGRMAARLSLDDFERDAILIALAPELDLKYEALYAYLNNGAARRQATGDLILRLCRDTGPCDDVPDQRRALRPGARLVDDGLLELLDGPEPRATLARPLAIAPALAAELQALPLFDARLTTWVLAVDRAPRLPAVWLAQLAASGEALSNPAPPIVVLESDQAQAPVAAAQELVRGAGRTLWRLDGGLAPERLPLAPLALAARLGDRALFVAIDDWGGEAVRRSLPGLLSSLWRARIPVVLAAAPGSDWRAVVHDLPTVRLRLPELDAPARRELWEATLADVGCAAPAEVLDDVAEHFRLGPAPIGRAGQALALGGPLAPAGARARLFAAAREQSSGNLGHFALRLPLRHGWSDLVVPPVVQRRLRDVAEAVRVRGRVFGPWAFGRRGSRGLMALFAGSSGTGKTMSASVIAREIGLDLYRIELANVVSKYIGETEKNLHAIFEAAQSANAILFFDEADALLGRRSEVKDAHDRHANVEVAYLLQKMDEHDGVVILASNLAKNMDPAFARRIHYVIEFPRPDAALRERLWRGVFPPEVPRADDVDFGFLARQFDLSGGELHTIALEAAFAAAAEDRAVSMADLVAAVSRQMLKQGRPLGASDFKQYHHVSGGSS